MKPFRSAFILCIVLLCFSSYGFAATVSLATARVVAENWLTHASADNRLAGNKSFRIVSEEVMNSNGQTVGYNFILSPAGHIIVPANDELPAVKLYSFTSTLKMTDPSETTEWIKEELFQLNNAVNNNAITFSKSNYNSGILYANSNGAETVNRQLWATFGKDASSFSRVLTSSQPATDGLSLGPLLTTTWGQGSPYNLNTPLTSSGTTTLAGCVATSAAQIMKFWNYPATGQGSTSYSWNNGSANVLLSANFAASAYDWDSMTASYNSSSATAQKNAVAKLMSDVGIAFHMNYGTVSSNAAMVKTPFTAYFKYKNSISIVKRISYASDSAWMQVFKNEVQNGRPSHFAMDRTGGGHAVVVDGYRNSPSEQIHINMGWGGGYDAWYVSNNIAVGSYNYNLNQQATIGIEPATPAVTTAVVSAITLTAATGGGRITDDGGSTVTSRGVCWGIAPGPATNCTSNGAGTGTFTSHITGLTANTTYYIRAYATNTNGTAYGRNVIFNTLAVPTVPTIVTTKPMRSITRSSATAGGNVTSDGGSSVTDKGVCWGTSPNPSATCKPVDTSAATEPFTCDITGLTTNTTYYVRAYATNSNGTAYGGDVTFKTGKRPVSFVLQPIR